MNTPFQKTSRRAGRAGSRGSVHAPSSWKERSCGGEARSPGKTGISRETALAPVPSARFSRFETAFFSEAALVSGKILPEGIAAKSGKEAIVFTKPASEAGLRGRTESPRRAAIDGRLNSGREMDGVPGDQDNEEMRSTSVRIKKETQDSGLLSIKDGASASEGLAAANA